MSVKKQFRGPWGQKFFIAVLGVVLGVLLYWLLGFVARDIGSMKGPDFSAVRTRHVDAEIVEQQRAFQQLLEQTQRHIRDQTEQRNLLQDTTRALQNTMNQLQRDSQQDRELSEQAMKMLLESRAAFLENQKKYAAYNVEISGLMTQQRELEEQVASVKEQLRRQEGAAKAEYGQLMERHRFKVAVVKLGVLLPVFLAAAWFFTTRRTGPYWPIVYAAFIAGFIKVAEVSWEYFPRRYFKYIALLVLIGIVLRVLVWLIGRIVMPKRDWLVKQYQQAYDKWRCPVCAKPICVGPLRFAGGTRAKARFGEKGRTGEMEQQVYNCPSCGTNLYDTCDTCQQIRHTLLPYCEHCGTEKPI